MFNKNLRESTKNLPVIILIFTFFPSTILTPANIMEPLSTLSITAATKEPSYHLRQKITIYGNLTSDGAPITTALVAVEVTDPKGTPLYFRTVPIGNPSETWAVEITDFSLKDLSGKPLTKAKIGSQAKVYITVKNKLLNSLEVATAITICDETLIPFFSGYSSATIPGGETSTSSWIFQIPEWAKPGKALAFINAYNNLPENLGFPYTPETAANFNIVRNLETEPSFSPQITTFNSTTGKYEVYLSVPPDRYTVPGTYNIFVTGRISPAVRVYGRGAFTLNSYPCPPQAAFTYSPLQVYQNMTVTFDASSSSAEGYNDTIIRYAWKINDPYNPRYVITTNPLITHTFLYPGIFTVELNVTDKEGLWSTTSKPITVQPEFGPTANFTWTPPIPMVNQTITFDASTSKSGWSATTGQFSPIILYSWNFGDGSIANTNRTTITHKYTQPANYTVTLTVTDAVGRVNTISCVIRVLNITAKDCDIYPDGFIDVMDLLVAAAAYGSYPGHPKWNPSADIDKNNFVDVMDLLIIASHYGEDP
jgi:PKD repeat protein